MTKIGSGEVVRLLKVGLDKAEEIGEPSCIGLVDGGGNILGFVRSDDATFGTAEIALSKAYTSAAFQIANGDLASDAMPGAEAYHVETSGRGRNFTAIAGGFPLFKDGLCVGALGVSGGPVAHDLIIARAMLDAFSA